MNLYKIDKVKMEEIKVYVLKVIEKSNHFKFFKSNLDNYSAINTYKGFASYENYLELNYLCWFVSVCLLEDYRDDICEFEYDLDSMAYTIDIIKKNNHKFLFCEIKYFLLAYKILCQANKKIKQNIDIEYWCNTGATQKDKLRWYDLYLPINLIIAS